MHRVFDHDMVLKSTEVVYSVVRSTRHTVEVPAAPRWSNGTINGHQVGSPRGFDFFVKGTDPHSGSRQYYITWSKGVRTGSTNASVAGDKRLHTVLGTFWTT